MFIFKSTLLRLSPKINCKRIKISNVRPYLFKSYTTEKNNEVKFDKEIASLYAKMAQKHQHENGPWKMIVDKVQAVMPSGNGSVLDIACGTGEPGVSIAEKFANTCVVGTDISPDMIEMAKKRCSDLNNITLKVEDAQNLKFENNSFDVVTCCYGHMFVPDLEKALLESMRVLKPGGYLITTVWVNLMSYHIGKRVMAEIIGKQPNEVPINPMSLSTPGLLEEKLKNAGFTLCESRESTYPFNFGNDLEDARKGACLTLTGWLKEQVEVRRNTDAYDIAHRVFIDFIKENNYITTKGEVIIGDNTFKMLVAQKSL